MSQRTASARPPRRLDLGRGLVDRSGQPTGSLDLGTRHAHDRRTEPGQAQRQALADPAGRARDDNDLAVVGAAQTVVRRKLARM